MIRIKKPKKIKNKLVKNPTFIKENDNELFVMSLKHIDKNQGDNFSKWEKESKLSKLLETICGYSSDKLINRVDNKKFTIYGDFPPKNKTTFEYPKHVPEDANWARIHIDGTHCLIGHIVNNMFYAVFLDGNHSFWKSTLKNT